ncbi:hypothetical protein AB1Y20_023356 [Prymnesium parvum]|uniref:Digalactosyldiacylglycerol synthase n=1 Tax=Prymnesium parvum TaxID=97485 RepID=A0AB34JG08_PRYPA
MPRPPPAPCPPKIAVDPTVSADTGGPEALVQLALALAALCPNSTYALARPTPIHPRFYAEYPRLAALRALPPSALRPGDVVVAPDVAYCNAKLAARGVHWYVWLLSSRARPYNWRSLQRGCRLLSHNHHLAHDTLAGVSLQPHWVLHPYVSPSIAAACAAPPRAARRRLVLLDSDTPDRVEAEVEAACCLLGCESVRVHNYTRAKVLELQRAAMIVVDWSMIGSERMPIEGVLCGAVLLTGAHLCGQDLDDFPIPRRNVLRHPSNLTAAIRRVLSDFAAEQRAQAWMRRKYMEINARSLRREAAAFLAAHAASAHERRYKSFYAPAESRSALMEAMVAAAKRDGTYIE